MISTTYVIIAHADRFQKPSVAPAVPLSNVLTTLPRLPAELLEQRSSDPWTFCWGGPGGPANLAQLSPREPISSTSVGCGGERGAPAMQKPIAATLPLLKACS